MSADSAAVVKVGSTFIILREEEARQAVGVAGTEILFLNVRQPGTYKVQMEYKRPWERISLEKFSFTVIAQG